MTERQFNKQMGKRLKELRRLQKPRVSQQEIGDLLGIHQTAVCRIEKGAQSLTVRQLTLILERFQVGFEEMTGGGDE